MIRSKVWCQVYTCEIGIELQCLLQVIVLNCLREGDLGKYSGTGIKKSVARFLVESAVNEIVLCILDASTLTQLGFSNIFVKEVHI